MSDKEKRSAAIYFPVVSSVKNVTSAARHCAPSCSTEEMYVDGHFVRCQTVHTSAEKHHKRPWHLSHWCIFCPAQICVSPLCTSLKWVPELGCLKSPLVSCFSLFFFFNSPSAAPCPVSMDPGLRMVPWSYTIGRRWSTERMATAGRRGKMERPPGRITWSWKSRESRWVCLFWVFGDWTGNGAGERAGVGWGGGNLHPDTDKHRSTSFPPLAVMETATCRSQPGSPRSLTKKQCSTTIVFPRKPVECNRLFVPY